MEVTFEEKDAAAAKKYGEAIVDTVESLGFDCKIVGVSQARSSTKGFKVKFLVEGDDLLVMRKHSRTWGAKH